MLKKLSTALDVIMWIVTFGTLTFIVTYSLWQLHLARIADDQPLWLLALTAGLVVMAYAIYVVVDNWRRQSKTA